MRCACFTLTGYRAKQQGARNGTYAVSTTAFAPGKEFAPNTNKTEGQLHTALAPPTAVHHHYDMYVQSDANLLVHLAVVKPSPTA